MATILTKPATTRPVFDDDIAERRNAIYDERLKDQLERDLPGKYVAIHVDSGDYEVAGWSPDRITL